MNHTAIKVHCISQEYWYIGRQRCRCGGHLEKVMQALKTGPTGEIDAITVRCKECGQMMEYDFDISTCGGPLFGMKRMQKISQYSKIISDDEAERAFGPPMETVLKFISELGQNRDELALEYLKDAIAHVRDKLKIS